jgi:hypothetical protein
MPADLLAMPAATDPEHGEFEALERIGGLGTHHRVGASSAGSRDDGVYAPCRGAQQGLGACDSQAHESAVAEVGLMLKISARTAACQVGDA